MAHAGRGKITLNMNPTIATLAIAGAQSQLVLPSGFTLTTVLNTTLSAGMAAMSGGTLAVRGNYTQTGGVLAYLVGCHVVVMQPVRNKASTAPRAQLRARSKASAYGLAAGSTCCPSCGGTRLSARSD